MVEQEILNAFGAIHSLGVIHGDIRAENILVGKDDSVWIVDFEFSRILSEETVGEEPQSKTDLEIQIVRRLLSQIKQTQRSETCYENEAFHRVTPVLRKFVPSYIQVLMIIKGIRPIISSASDTCIMPY